MKMKYLAPLFVCLSTVAIAKPLIGIVIPMRSEAKFICQQYFNNCQHPTTVNRVRFYRGNFAGHPAVLNISGMGLVFPSITTSTLINHFNPNILVMMGSAGGINSNRLGDVAISNKVFNLEFGSFDAKDDRETFPASDMSSLINPNNNQLQPLILGTNNKPQLLHDAKQTAKYFHQHPLHSAYKATPTPRVKSDGIIADSTVFYTPDSMTKEIKKAGVDVIAFEDVAFLQTCWFYHKPCVTFRSVSNVLPVDHSNPPASASYAGENATKVAEKYLQYYFKNNN